MIVNAIAGNVLLNIVCSGIITQQQNFVYEIWAGGVLVSYVLLSKSIHLIYIIRT